MILPALHPSRAARQREPPQQAPASLTCSRDAARLRLSRRAASRLSRSRRRCNPSLKPRGLPPRSLQLRLREGDQFFPLVARRTVKPPPAARKRVALSVGFSNQSATVLGERGSTITTPSAAKRVAVSRWQAEVHQGELHLLNSGRQLSYVEGEGLFTMPPQPERPFPTISKITGGPRRSLGGFPSGRGAAGLIVCISAV